MVQNLKMSESFAELGDATARFVLPLLEQLQELGFSNEILAIDHVCYRVTSLQRYEECKVHLQSMGHLLSEAFINGRPIACYKLASPIAITSSLATDVLELPAPGAEAKYEEGLEHAEVVVRSSLTALIKRFPDLPFKKQNLTAPVNADISLRLTGGLVKFHEQSLETIIEREKEELRHRLEKWSVIFNLDGTLLVDAKAPTGVASMMSCLVSEGVAIHIWTSRSLKDAKEDLRTSGLDVYVSSLHVGSKCDDIKPMPSEEIKAVAKRGRAVMIGSSDAERQVAAMMAIPFFHAGWAKNGRPGIVGDAFCGEPLMALTQVMLYFRSGQSK